MKNEKWLIDNASPPPPSMQASPLTGFMTEEQFLKCIHFNQIDGVNQSVPIVLPTDAEGKAAIAGKDFITLTFEGKDVAIMKSPEVYDHVKEERASRTFGLNQTGECALRCIAIERATLVSFLMFNYSGV